MIAANGNDKEGFFQNTIDGVSGIDQCSIFDASKLRTSYVGEVKKDMPVQSEQPADKNRFQYIAETAIKEMLLDSGYTVSDIEKMGRKAYISFATSLGSNDKIMGYAKDKLDGKFNEEWLPKMPNVVSWVKNICGVKGGSYVITSACAAGTTAAGVGFDLISEGKADLVIVGGADPLTEFSCTGFHSLKSLSTSICKPFDVNRDGINIGEGGAFMVLETLESAKKRNAKIYGEVLGYGINNDAYHITSPDPNGSGAIASMGMAMKHTNLKKEDINYVNAHGTGTKLNDEMEVGALTKFFQGTEHEVFVSSNKSMIGHCLAAAGAIEMAATLLSIYNKKTMPNVSLDDKMECSKNQNYVTESQSASVRYALSNSFAFAGNAASILVGAYEED